MNNIEFLETIKQSFEKYLNVGTSRSTAKLKSLHGKIALDLHERLGDKFEIKAQGYEDDLEGEIGGRYYSKKVDIIISCKGKAIAGYAVKFVMRNYSQNSNNYFENMLGETANIRANSIPYFQIFIIFDKVPYYEKEGQLKKYDIISQHNVNKYLELSKDDPTVYFHTPDKTLFVLINLKEKAPCPFLKNQEEYANYYKSFISDTDLIQYSSKIKDVFDSSVIYNDYENFINRTIHIILGKLK